MATAHLCQQSLGREREMRVESGRNGKEVELDPGRFGRTDVCQTQIVQDWEGRLKYSWRLAATIFSFDTHTHTHIHTYTYTHIYRYMCTCKYTRQHYRSIGARPTNRVGAPESRVF